MAAIRADDYAAAKTELRQSGRVALDIVEWFRLRDGKGTPSEVLDFLNRNPDWPGLSYLREQSEGVFGNASYKQVEAFFGAAPAQTPEGALIKARILARNGKTGDAEAEIVQAWRTMDIGPEWHDLFLSRHGALLKSHHQARMDFLLWKGWKNNVGRMMPLVSEDWQKLATARLALRDMDKGVDGLIEAVPASLKNDPGLAYERFQWRARKGRDDSAIELLLERAKAGTLGDPASWGGWQRALTRSKMREGQYKTAYAVASNHAMTPSMGYGYSDLEWLAGYIALRFLNSPGVALGHFKRFEASVETPISLGRAGYWIGRAYDAMGESANAQAAYRRGGAHQTSFYGLLAAEKAGLSPDPELSGNETFPDWRQAAFTKSRVHQAALLFLEAGELTRAEQFWVHLSETQDRTGLGQMGQMAQDLGAPHVAVMLGKDMVRRGITLPGPYYPLHPLVRQRLPVATEMALAIARRESEFDPVVVSHAGAMGLMQLMPGTAKLVAGRLGQEYSKYRLTADPVYNATLGSEYLAGLAEQFDGNVIMVSAGYNAGPGRPERWMKEMGDPRRRGGMDIIDWIEHIPFNETRNYVMRVAESLPVYRARLGLNPHPVPFSKELVGNTIKVRR